MAEALATNIRGVAETGGKVRDLASIPLPIASASLVTAYATDVQALNAVVRDYREHRALVDDTLDEAL